MMKFVRGILNFDVMYKICLIIVIGLVCLSADLQSSFTKKIDKTLFELWKNQSVIKEDIDITKFQFSNNYLRLTKLTVNNKLIGYYMLSRAKSRIDFFDYMVVYNPNLTILTIQVLAYREDHGREITSKRWLKQFDNKGNPDSMKFGYDIQSISGATMSARSLTQDVQEVTKNIQLLKSKGAL